MLSKLKVGWQPGAAKRDYNAGRSTHVPMTPRVRLSPGNHFDLKLRNKTTELTIEQYTTTNLRPVTDLFG